MIDSPRRKTGSATRPLDRSAANGFSGNRIDSRSEQRGENALTEARADPQARFALMRDDRAILKVRGERLDGLFTETEALALGALAETILLLGFDGNLPRLAASIPEEAELPGDVKAIDLRSLAQQDALAPYEVGIYAQARSLLHWHHRHGFCANCGAKTDMTLGGFRRDCPVCDAKHFPRTDPVVIMLVVDGDRCLLGRQERFVPGMYSCLAGFMEPGETIENAVRREVLEESGIVTGEVNYHSCQPWPFPSTLMIGCIAEARTTDIHMDDKELEDCRWFSRGETALMLSRTHPDGLTAPLPFAIAHHLVKAFVENSG